MAKINTTRGEMDTENLEHRWGGIDNEHERTEWVEYWLDGEMVHRSVHVNLKKNIVAESIAAFIG